VNTIVRDLLKSRAAEHQADELSIVMLFCSIGLIASLCMATLGFDVKGGMF
jgi:hypothetical protein